MSPNVTSLPQSQGNALPSLYLLLWRDSDREAHRCAVVPGRVPQWELTFQVNYRSCHRYSYQCCPHMGFWPRSRLCASPQLIPPGERVAENVQFQFLFQRSAVSFNTEFLIGWDLGNTLIQKWQYCGTCPNISLSCAHSRPLIIKCDFVSPLHWTHCLSIL